MQEKTGNLSAFLKRARICHRIFTGFLKIPMGNCGWDRAREFFASARSNSLQWPLDLWIRLRQTGMAQPMGCVLASAAVAVIQLHGRRKTECSGLPRCA